MKLGEVLESDGRVPLPPYIKREADASDLHTYQTAHAVNEGSVAAPTAGLHFSESLFSSIKSKGSKVTAVTLHVGAGTFKPMDSDDASKHEMHAERISVPMATIDLLKKAILEGSPLIPIGTTSTRTLESLYWWGVKLKLADCDQNSTELRVDQWDPYRVSQSVGENLISLVMLIPLPRDDIRSHERRME
mmetsp:Transcript_44909/g.70377  ORF Transcript_44909/g.70377 Transcript_44909/m.70377 type:complete len:190 (+) Transcript_44909:1020-1589(+)